MNKQDLFKQFIEEYKKSNTKKKCEELVEKQKRILSLLSIYQIKNNNRELELLKSKEIKDIVENTEIDDYLEAMMVYMQNIEESIGQILM